MLSYSFTTIARQHDGNSNNEAVTSKNLLPGSTLGTLYDIKVVVKYEVHAKTCHDGAGERTQNFLASTSVSLLTHPLPTYQHY